MVDPDPGITLRAAAESDVPFLLELRRLTMTAHQMASGVVPSEEERERRVRTHFECANIVHLDGRPIGLLKVARDGDDWELIQIHLHPDCQKQGLGSRLLESVIDQARMAGARLRLSVLKQNPARRLYERLGFTIVGEGVHSYEMRLIP